MYLGASGDVTTHHVESFNKRLGDDNTNYAMAYKIMGISINY